MKTIKDLKSEEVNAVFNNESINDKRKTFAYDLALEDLYDIAIKRVKYYLSELEGLIILSEIQADSSCVWKHIYDEAYSYIIKDRDEMHFFLGKAEELIELFNLSMEDLE